MKSFRSSVILLSILLMLMACDFIEASSMRNLLSRFAKSGKDTSHDKRSWKMKSHEKQQQQRGLFSCKEEGESCRGFPKCCGDMQCYWEDGYSAITAGKCISCVGDGMTCQRDGQCCEGLVCQKESMYHVNGECAAKLPLGAECHDNDQCESEYCHITWYNDVGGSGGQCENNYH